MYSITFQKEYKNLLEFDRYDLIMTGIGTMIDFGPLLTNPKLMLLSAAAQFGIFFTLCMASMFFPDFRDFFSTAVENLQYTGVGMLVIFVIIGVIILATKLVNYLFSE